MALNLVSKINTHVKFLYRKDKFLSSQLKSLLCKPLIQPHSDYARSVWYPKPNKKLKAKSQTLQNKCVRFCLQLDNRAHVGVHLVFYISSQASYMGSSCLYFHGFRGSKLLNGCLVI